jgi:hypothetical protein
VHDSLRQSLKIHCVVDRLRAVRALQLSCRVMQKHEIEIGSVAEPNPPSLPYAMTIISATRVVPSGSLHSGSPCLADVCARASHSASRTMNRQYP